MNSLDAIKKSESESFKKKNPHIFGGVKPYCLGDGGEDDAEHDHIEALTSKPEPKVGKEQLHQCVVCGEWVSNPSKHRHPFTKPKKPKRIRQSEKPLLNKLEQAYARVLEARRIDIMGEPTPIPFFAQAIRFKLSTGLHYTPDFFSFTTMTAWEVKGPKAWEDSLIKLRMAAKVWPKIKWMLVWKDEQGQWQEQHVLP